MKILRDGLLVNGRWIAEGSPVTIRSPFDGQQVGVARLAGPNHLEQAITGAAKTFAVTRKLPAYKRQGILRSISQGIHENCEDFVRMMALEAGKPVKAARIEVERAIFTFAVAAEESVRIGGEYLPMDLQPSTDGRWGMVRRFPVGPISAITPFNFPLNLVAHKIAPAIAAGCTIIVKPAPQTPFCALMLGELVRQAGWPDGGLSVLPMTNDDAQPLITDDRMKVLSFTGSARVGWQLKQESGKKRVVLELGGNAAVIIHKDADLEFAAERCAAGGFSYAGQSCISVQRILVDAAVYASFLDSLVAKVKALKIGNPSSEETDIGPLIRELDAIRTESWIKEAIAGGATLLTGGERRGSLMLPTILTGTKPEMKVNCEEVFAPVVTVEAYQDIRSAIALSNASPYGLQAGVFTNDARVIFQCYDELEVGGVIVNDVPTFRIDHMPYGGTKDSGLGREGVRYAIEEMTERKLLVMQT